MTKKIAVLFVAFMMACNSGALAYDDAFDFENIAIVDGGDIDITTETVALNDGAAPANVANFDIAGVYLGMSFEDVQELFFNTNGLYTPRKKDSIIYTIANDWRYNLDYECRQQNIFVPAQLENCIRTLARSRGLLYASEVHLTRENTGETLTLYFTSNASDNQVWRIEYNNDVNELDGADEKFENQRQKKILAFWQSVLDKYGAPNSGSDKWISSANAYDPMMSAYYGALVLMDNGRNASDAAKNVQQAREHFQTKPYAF